MALPEVNSDTIPGALAPRAPGDVGSGTMTLKDSSDQDTQNKTRSWAQKFFMTLCRIAAGVGIGAAAGAAFGSAVPGIGTAAGAAMGAVLGFIVSMPAAVVAANEGDEGDEGDFENFTPKCISEFLPESVQKFFGFLPAQVSI